MKKILVGLTIAVLSASSFAIVCTPPIKRNSHGKIARSSYQVAAFKKQTICPATGKIEKSCKGFVVDHIVPLCACGDDKPFNMQWQSLAEAAKKDAWERRMCNGSGD